MRTRCTSTPTLFCIPRSIHSGLCTTRSCKHPRTIWETSQWLNRRGCTNLPHIIISMARKGNLQAREPRWSNALPFLKLMTERNKGIRSVVTQEPLNKNERQTEFGCPANGSRLNQDEIGIQLKSVNTTSGGFAIGFRNVHGSLGRHAWKSHHRRTSWRSNCSSRLSTSDCNGHSNVLVNEPCRNLTLLFCHINFNSISFNLFGRLTISKVFNLLIWWWKRPSL